MNAPPPPSSSIAHRWDLTPTAAIALQRELAGRIDLRAPAGFAPRTIAGVDIGFEDEGRTTRAAIVVLDSAALLPLSHVVARRPTTFPYVPGLLSFRELPAALAAFELLPARPDLLMVDGHGISHPRRLGVAAHLGLLLDLPAIGVAKSRLTGHHGPVPEPRGEWTPLFAGPARARSTEVIGAVLRSRAGVQPIIVSPGHRMDLDTALHWVRHCLTRYRLPEPTRWADGLASRRAGILRQLEPLPPP